jgi:hypothetical protein
MGVNQFRSQHLKTVSSSISINVPYNIIERFSVGVCMAIGEVREYLFMPVVNRSMEIIKIRLYIRR